MAIKIGSNIASLQAQRRLGDASSSLEKIYERLSSGQRINRASDDAAGLAISEKLNADSKVFAQGIRNINDSLSLFAITEQATSSLKTIVIRSKELAEQSANGVYSDSQRLALNNELQALGNEYNRILSTTTFNGKKLFSRDDTQLVTQTGNSQLVSSNSAARASEIDQVYRVSVGLNGSEADNSSNTNLNSRSAISNDGRYILFESIATNMIANDLNSGTGDVFLQDQRTGEITLISQSSAGVQGDGTSVVYRSAISEDSKYVVFASNSTNLVANDTNPNFDIFVRNLQTGETRMVSTSSSGQQSNGNTTQFGSISADGRYVVFQSNATNLVAGDGNGNNDIFRKDLITGETVRVSTSSLGLEGSGNHVTAAISADGRYVTFGTSSTNLFADANGSVSDIVRKDMLTGELQLVSSASDGTQSNANSNSTSISADGRYIVFTSSGTNLVAGDANGFADIFRKDMLTGELQLVSSSSSGVISSGGASGNASISADGRYVVFESSANNLVEGDTNGVSDVFIKDMQTGKIRRANVSESGDQASAGSSPSASRIAISSDGNYVAFRSSFTDQLDGASTASGRSHMYATSNSLSEKYQLTRFQWMDVLTQSESKKTLTWLGQYEGELDKYIGQLGATTSRLATASSVLQSTRENYKAAESRIKDADIAAESANLVRTQILQQAAASVLSQANLQPQLALKLLG